MKLCLICLHVNHIPAIGCGSHNILDSRDRPLSALEEMLHWPIGKALGLHLRYPARVSPSPEKKAGPSAAGLCAECLHARRIESSQGSIFYLCELSHCDPRFPKYPRLPVLSCGGYKKKP
jgi:hypothetical protein